MPYIFITFGVWFVEVWAIHQTALVNLPYVNQTSNILVVCYMEIEIWSDVLCPFCYIGKRKFEHALQQFEGKDKVKITWKSFQLDPDFRSGEIREYPAYLQKSKGWSAAQTAQIMQNVTETAQKAGLDFHFEKAIIANSFQAHRLLQYAKQKDKQKEVKEAIMRAHFTEGKDIGDTEFLTSLAISVGLPEAEIKTLWASDAMKSEVDTDIYEARQLGVRGVPFFVFNRKYAVSGAQESATFLEILEKVQNEKA